MILIILATCFFANIIGVYNTIEVDPVNGNDTVACFHGSVLCQHLTYVLSHGLPFLNNSQIILLAGIHDLRGDFRMHNIYNMSVVGNNSIVKCSEKSASGLSFFASVNITFSNFTISNCGARHKSTTFTHNATHVLTDQPNIYIGLNFVYCKNVLLEKSKFLQNNGIGVAFYNIMGTLNVLSCVFKNNSNLSNRNVSDMYVSGGGIYIEYTLCDSLSSYTCQSFPDYNKNALIKISDSVFHGNIADNRYGLWDASGKINSSYLTFGEGGGVSINFFGNSSTNDIDISSCEFTKNSAMWGGGLCVTLKDEAERNTIDIYNSYFDSNNATYAGGGVRIESLYTEDFQDIYQSIVTSGNNINIHNSTFVNNQAILGGGVSITATTRLLYVSSNASRDVIIENCSFLANKATVGYALGLNTINLNKEIVGPGMSYRVRVKDSDFTSNKMVFTEDKQVIGHGCLYSDQVTLVFDGINYFSKNSFSAVVLDSSSLYFEKHSSTKFVRNNGFQGGALALFGLSWCMLGYRSTIMFKNNTALSKGGAMYVKPGSPPRVAFNTTLLSTIQCFFRYENHNIEPDGWPVQVVFDGNRSPNGTGNSVYASTLQFCRTPGDTRERNRALNWKPFTYINNFDAQAEIVTNAINLYLNLDEWNPYPFLPFSPEITMLDEKRQSVFGSVKLRIKTEQGVKLDPPNNNFLIRDKLSRLRLVGKVRAKFAFQFISTTGQLFQSPKFNGSMRQCPPGFRPDGKGDRCICMDAENGDVIKCDENGTVYLLKGKWGYIHEDDGILRTVQCPPHVCKCKNEMADYLCELDLQDQCIDGRNGTLCGQCGDGLSVLLGNEACKPCDSTNLYIIIVCFIIGMPLFIMFILYNDFDAFSGYLNAFLYSCQMSTVLVTESADLDPVISFIIGITSFAGTGGNFGICLYDGMDNIRKLGLNYVLPASLILFTCLIGMATPDSLWRFIFRRKKAKNTSNDSDGNEVRKRSFGRAFGFVSVLCYSSITETTFRVFRYVSINNETYLFSAGTKYFSRVHIGLFVIACVLGLFVIAGFPFLLMFQTKFANKYTFFRKIDFIVTALKSCFKIKYHYFASFYFTCRFVLLLIDTIVQEQISKLIVLACCCVVILVIFNYFQPYELWTYNLFDVLILSNLTLLSLLSIIINVPFSLEDDDRDRAVTLCSVLIWLPVLITFLRFLFWFVMKRREKDRTDSVDGDADKLVVQVPSRVLESINDY